MTFSFIFTTFTRMSDNLEMKLLTTTETSQMREETMTVTVTRRRRMGRKVLKKKVKQRYPTTVWFRPLVCVPAP